MLKPFDIVIFGGAGDLALRKLIPALYRAYNERSLPEQFRIVAVCRTAEEVNGYADCVQKSLETYLNEKEFSKSVCKDFKKFILALALDITDLKEGWSELADKLTCGSEADRIFYMAIPPSLYGKCCENLAAQNLITDNSRIVLEKPIGYDGISANVINDQVGQYFPERAIFRIDHYLGKETVQNLLALRFSNVLFEQLWDAKSIDHVQISITESVGLEGRASFYDGAGAMRDMVQNHLLQLLCLVAMESPNKLNEKNIRAEKLKVMEALRPILKDDVKRDLVRGQYVSGSIDDKLVPGYLEELGEPRSDTETYVAIRAHIDNWRWAGVPFYLRTGKRLKERCAEIVIQFKDVSHLVYPDSQEPLIANRLVIRLQPAESIQLLLMTKNLEKTELELQPVALNLNFADTYQDLKSDAYKRLLLDVAADNPSLFIHREEVELAWDWIDPIMETWAAGDCLPTLYRSGGWGPEAADDLLAADGRAWINPEAAPKNDKPRAEVSRASELASAGKEK